MVHSRSLPKMGTNTWKNVISVRQYTLSQYGWQVQHPLPLWKKNRNYLDGRDAFTCTNHNSQTSWC